MNALVRMLQTLKSSACFDEYWIVGNTKSTVPSECLSTSGGFRKFYCRNRKVQRMYLNMRNSELDQNYSFYKGNKKRKHSGDHTCTQRRDICFTTLTFIR